MIDKALEEFNKLLANLHSTLGDLTDIVNQLSVVDEIASKDAVTHLYTRVLPSEYKQQFKMKIEF